MAQRPIFTPDPNEPPYVNTVEIEFKWYPGFVKSQLQKSIASLHESAEQQGISPILEISGKSASPLGVSLSAFNLELETPRGLMSVECAYQGSKVFEGGGPYHELYAVPSREAKTDNRLQDSGELIGFNFCGEDFPIEPQTAFYDWLYIKALWQQKDSNLAQELIKFEGFSDIVFNPKRSLNCQARAAAQFVSLSKNGLLPDDFPISKALSQLSQNGLVNEQILQNKDYYLRLLNGEKRILPFPQNQPDDYPISKALSQVSGLHKERTK